jgi:hypothetical protein
MTEKQIIILAALACAVLCVLAGGAYVVISEERIWQGEDVTAIVTSVSVFGRPTIAAQTSYKVADNVRSRTSIQSTS